jgi:hypothetical protein
VGICNLLAAAPRRSFPGHARIVALTAILENSLKSLIEETEGGLQADPSRLMVVLDAIEFHFDQFNQDASWQ